MNAGDLDKRVILQGQATARNPAGENVGTWSEIATVWASIRPASSREIMLNQGAAQQVTHTVSIRYRPGVTSGQRIIYGTRIFDVAGVINVDEANVELRLVCYETGVTP